ncbi:MAG: phage Gp37/Gp68 family protein [Proteobacteria bacterium]|nr:phage Gp37/Gp68 family protein [Pseudomonadota bacterium]
MTTQIEWANEHWEPVGGCTDEGPACANCYARERQLPRLVTGLTGRKSRPAVKTRLKRYSGLVKKAPMGAARNYQWTGKLVLWPDRLVAPLRWRRSRGRVFVCSQSDLFHELRPLSHIAAVLSVMAHCWETTFLVLTKRVARMHEVISDAWHGSDCGELSEALRDENPFLARAIQSWRNPTGTPPNIWLGVSVSNQVEADEKIPVLLRTPAAKRFISYEPALGPLTLQYERGWLEPFQDTDPFLRPTARLDWVIAGAESTHGKRPGRPARVNWFRSVRDECALTRTPFFLKQMATGIVLPSGKTEQRIVGTPELDGQQWTEVPQ